ncbi:flocculation protein FLO11 [Aplysia californica]|uniref:Flocculation protein FLO11 n=1 Tax=Aplysia californica TaxID=6500 RepID=A0ABM0ZYD1_APLCA|nr:flocculation protein FLO11 [Aplysia californica]
MEIPVVHEISVPAQNRLSRHGGTSQPSPGASSKLTTGGSSSNTVKSVSGSGGGGSSSLSSSSSSSSTTNHFLRLSKTPPGKQQPLTIPQKPLTSRGGTSAGKASISAPSQQGREVLGKTDRLSTGNLTNGPTSFSGFAFNKSPSRVHQRTGSGTTDETLADVNVPPPASPLLNTSDTFATSSTSLSPSPSPSSFSPFSSSSSPVFPHTSPSLSSSSSSPSSSSTSTHLRGMHARLPSTDSGIQADAGFDSLSRYRGKNFLSTSYGHEHASGAEDCSSLGRKTRDSSVASSSGYNTDTNTSLLQQQQQQQQAKQQLQPTSKGISSSPLTVSPSRVIPISAPASFMSAASPLTSLSISSCAATSRAGDTATSGVRTCSSDASSSSSSSSLPSSSSSSTAVNGKHFVEANSSIQVAPAVKVIATPGRVRLSFCGDSDDNNSNNSNNNSSTSNNSRTITISSSPSSGSSPHHHPSLPTPSSSISISHRPHTGVTGPSTSSSSASSSNKAPPPGSTLRLHVGNPPTRGSTPSATADASQQRMQGQGRLGNVRQGQGQGCIALTRPLKVAAPPKLSVRAVQPTSLSAQTVVPVTRHTQSQLNSNQTASNVQKQQQQQQQQQPRQKPAITRPKPQIAPRSLFISTTSNGPSKNSATNNGANNKMADNNTSTSTASPRLQSQKPLVPAKPFAASTNKTDSTGKSEIPVTHSAKMAAPRLPDRTEIPVKHVDSCTASFKTNSNDGTLKDVSNSQDKNGKARLKEPASIDRIYENVNLLRDGFKFDDEKTKLKHAELILKHSDELINDALKMFGDSPIDLKAETKTTTSGSSENTTSPIGERIVEGADEEYLVPVLDVRTGKIHKGGKLSHYADGVKEPRVGESKNGSSWKERKERIDSSLSWLKNELADLRAMDNTLISQFKRCQDTIETLKNQRDFWEGLCEEGEEADYWDDYEINEFNRRYLDSPGGSSCSQLSPGSRDTSLQDMTSLTLPVPQLRLAAVPAEVTGSGRRGSLTQDVEVTL